MCDDLFGSDFGRVWRRTNNRRVVIQFISTHHSRGIKRDTRVVWGIGLWFGYVG